MAGELQTLTQCVKKAKGDKTKITVCETAFTTAGGTSKADGGKVFTAPDGGKVFVTDGGKVFSETP
ncbi:MAG: hypothetical protein ABI562_04630 [Chloroflexota bacterium]